MVFANAGEQFQNKFSSHKNVSTRYKYGFKIENRLSRKPITIKNVGFAAFSIVSPPGVPYTSTPFFKYLSGQYHPYSKHSQ